MAILLLDIPAVLRLGFDRGKHAGTGASSSMDSTQSFSESSALPAVATTVRPSGRSGSKQRGTRSRSIAAVSTLRCARFCRKTKTSDHPAPAQLPANLGKSLVRIVNSQMQPKLRSGREHPVRLIGALADQIVDQDPDIAICPRNSTTGSHRRRIVQH